MLPAVEVEHQVVCRASGDSHLAVTPAAIAAPARSGVVLDRRPAVLDQYIVLRNE